MLAVILYAVGSIVVMFILVTVMQEWLKHRRNIWLEQAKLDHERRMKEMEQEQRWLEVAESEYEDERS